MIMAAIAPTGRSLLADVTNNKLADSTAMLATRSAGWLMQKIAKTITIPMITVTSSISAIHVMMLVTRSGRFRKSTIYTAVEASGIP